jgi:hypothetical protein
MSTPLASIHSTSFELSSLEEEKLEDSQATQSSGSVYIQFASSTEASVSNNETSIPSTLEGALPALTINVP